MKSINLLVLAVVVVAAAAFSFSPAADVIKNPGRADDARGFAVVELFTSEGCSSCPPADALVEKIQRENNNDQIYILAFHVDYWDHQGWKDRFGDPEFSNRQRQYAEWLNLGTLYTPQVVVNGATEYVGSDESRIGRAIANGLAQSAANVLTLKGTLADKRVDIVYQVSVSKKDTELVLALVQKSALSKVKAGENMGRSLAHIQIVRGLLRVPVARNDQQNVSLNFPDDGANGWEVIGFVQQKSDGHILGAARFDVN
ncbi:DUF1223 domain-containing protein [Chryseolinea sp. Jin1]|uniref:DUF1223 domain-containing protein n=2 Tax=Chryseolinea lacunae TaxID=2801331 RepID=A0ABS1KMK3_9BACT|nr:DUF1223 domain-containing protein [Chryseolinea lacunae]